MEEVKEKLEHVLELLEDIHSDIGSEHEQQVSRALNIVGDLSTLIGDEITQENMDTEDIKDFLGDMENDEKRLH